MKDLSKFLRESEEEATRPLKDDEGADDEQYWELMNEYKKLRRTDREAADKILAQALELSEKGDVSQKKKLAAAYL
ncbi:hypothetical protein [Synechococcus phage S-N03]|uniref:Uncharacterized protein n=1 Tax=Synechococcus phage S-N03 TaxID=2718943 RepID=A0A6G8R5W2_9CAUD|nr:hypothetical protein PQC09_gp137 [Synechococcus phage S-N03]QIN96772.1 hypothetical protein [Synechococcus phage S-N03]